MGKRASVMPLRVPRKIRIYIPNNTPNKVVFLSLMFGENGSVSNKEPIS